ncbi:MAG: hypothetical protein GEU94_12115 [Micromonosporaceae bacterium]|nr:hypothetical protein [Micromonosporaceae bacterium]
MRHRPVAVAVAALLLASGVAACGERDPLQVGTPKPASPAAAPSPTASAAGMAWRVPGAARAEAITVESGGRRLAVGVDNPPRLAILNAVTGETVHSVTLSAVPSHVAARPGGGFRAVAGRELVAVTPDGDASTSPLPWQAGQLALLPDGAAAVAFPGAGRVGVYGADGQRVRVIKTGGRPTGIAASGRTVGVVDADATSLAAYDTKTGERAEELRAGNGALHVVADAKGRFVVADTRDGELLVFATGPLYLRQRYPVTGSPYGMAYDPRRHVVWVTVTAKNQVVGYDLSGGAPREVARHDTVRQPNSVAVDLGSGTVFVAGQAQGVVQSIPG